MSKKQENLVGQDIGIYKVLYECNYKSNDGHKLYHVKCNQCGWETDMRLTQAKCAKQCNHLDRFGKYIDKKFRWKNKRIGSIFNAMKDRCYSITNSDYKYWGAKGIRVYQQWLDNPKSFEDWALSHGYADNLTIDRIEESKNYCPENCHWVTLEDNARYKSTTSEIEVDGVIHTGRDWAKYLNIGTNVINIMLRNYNEDIVKEFIRKRLENPTLMFNRKIHKSWLDVYEIAI